MKANETLGAFRPVAKTGVIFVTSEATKSGYDPTDPEWLNLGQGQPETGELEGAPPRLGSLAIDIRDQEYAPIAGVWELRDAIASFYNRAFRKGLRSQYTAENVCVSGGGRVSLARAAASLGHVNLGHFLPDYTAYEELLDIFRAFTSIPILLDPADEYVLAARELRREIEGRGLGALLMSNPNNPTGRLVMGANLLEWIEACRDRNCSLLVDEFYSHYIWEVEKGRPAMESAATYVERVDTDPVLLFDGLTKNWRYPGWRVTWTLGPRKIIDSWQALALSWMEAEAGRCNAPRFLYCRKVTYRRKTQPFRMRFSTSEISWLGV